MDLSASEGRKQFQVDRIAYFSDAVFAIAITLLALNIQVPALTRPTDAALLAALEGLLPKILGFVNSFLVIGVYWRAHHRMFGWVRGYNTRLVSLNMRLLLCITFIPVPTAFFSQYPDSRVGLMFYTASLAIVGVAHLSLRRYIFTTPDLHDPAVPPEELALMWRRSLVVPLVCVSAVILAAVNLWMARVALMSIPVAIVTITLVAEARERRRGRLLARNFGHAPEN